MAATLTIQISKDEATPFMHRLVDHLKSEDLRKIIGRGLQQDVKKHLITYDQKHPNKHGQRRTHIFRDAAKATHSKVTPRGIRVAISHPMIGLRYFGGTIKPVKAKLLAIPIDPTHPAADPQAKQAYGKSPKRFHHLRLIMFGKTGVGALVARSRTNIVKDRRKGRKGRFRGKTIKGGGIYYWLVPSATIKANRTILPTNSTMITSAIKHADDYIDSKNP